MERWKRARKPPPRKKCGKSGFARLPFFAALPARALASAGQMQSGTGGATDAEGRCNRLRPFMSQNPRFLATKPRSGTDRGDFPLHPADARTSRQENARSQVSLLRQTLASRARARFRGQKSRISRHERPQAIATTRRIRRAACSVLHLPCGSESVRGKSGKERQSRESTLSALPPGRGLMRTLPPGRGLARTLPAFHALAFRVLHAHAPHVPSRFRTPHTRRPPAITPGAARRAGRPCE